MRRSFRRAIEIAVLSTSSCGRASRVFLTDSLDSEIHHRDCLGNTGGILDLYHVALVDWISKADEGGHQDVSRIGRETNIIA